ncbi:MAG: SDR family NAD(P)-dependent oxidoreductase, partial [Proteobacteria bacterium]|nr:SDR family NAD(P)-dependent oxidoreductase [Pseudomonadota bacterium]
MAQFTVCKLYFYSDSMTSRTVLVTGAAQRIGAAVVRHLHGRGMNMVIHYHQSKQSAEDLADELNDQRDDSAYLVQGDLRDVDSYRAIIESALSFKQRLDVLINNASSFYPTPVGSITSDDWHDLITVNMQAPLFLSQQAAEHLGKVEGCIINMTDIHADRPLREHTVYCAAKA